MFAAFTMLIFIHFCALITPGPDFFLVSQTAISRSRKEAVAVVLGITVGVMFWSLLALLGLNILFEKMAWLKHILLICGGLYLCWLGVQMLGSAFSKKPLAMNTDLQLSKSTASCFMKGMLTNLSNPKAVIYFGSVFSLFLTNPVLEHLHAALFVTISVETLLWFLFVTFVFSLPACKAVYQRSVKWIDGISGGIFTLFGAFLITNK